MLSREMGRLKVYLPSIHPPTTTEKGRAANDNVLYCFYRSCTLMKVGNWITYTLTIIKGNEGRVQELIIILKTLGKEPMRVDLKGLFIIKCKVQGLKDIVSFNSLSF